jgi:hypothetical protein
LRVSLLLSRIVRPEIPEHSMARKKRPSDEHWEVVPAGQMRRKHGLYAENRPVIKLDP